MTKILKNLTNNLEERLENIKFSDDDDRILQTPSRPKVRPKYEVLENFKSYNIIRSKESNFKPRNNTIFL